MNDKPRSIHLDVKTKTKKKEETKKTMVRLSLITSAESSTVRPLFEYALSLFVFLAYVDGNMPIVILENVLIRRCVL